MSECDLFQQIKREGKLDLACSLWVPGGDNYQVHQQCSLIFTHYKLGLAVLGCFCFLSELCSLGAVFIGFCIKHRVYCSHSDENWVEEQ